jgi:hypothetical protein
VSGGGEGARRSAAEPLVELRGDLLGVSLRGRLPAAFGRYLRPPAGPPALAVEVAYRRVGGLAPADEEVWAATSAPPAIDERLALFRHGDGFGLAVGAAPHGRFLLTAETIAIEWVGEDGARAAHHFVSHALPLWLESRGVTVLHASAVAFAGRAVAFLGRSGIGKSTLCAELARTGGEVVCDDGLALYAAPDGGWRCAFGPPLLKLWPSALTGRLGIDPAPLARVHAGLEKRLLPLAATASAAAPPLAAVCFLAPRRRRNGSPRLAPVAPREAVVALVEHSLAAAPAAALGLSRARFETLARIAESVPLRRLDLALDTRAEALRDELLRVLAR